MNKALDSLHTRILNSKFAEEVTETEIEALIQAKNNDWIPCSERLPEEDGYYLTTTIFYHLYNPVVMGCNFEDGRWLYMNSNDEVIAWQPLPQPYKEGSADNA